jgi:uncharacterized protein (DUF305 family)
MNRSLQRVRTVSVVVALAIAAGTWPTGAAAQSTPAQAAGSTAGQSYYTAADVAFMTGMIGHHAQAVLIAGWAPSHGASRSLRAMCERIVVGQQDEIALMKRWLRDRHQPVPDADASHAMMPGMDQAMMPMMPGMLTAEQLVQLDQARGPAFDRMFLTFMIQHHKGAIVMVFGSKGAGEEERVFRFASDVYADQTTEIDRMQKMLAALPSE